jgi:Kdo-III transferase WaaZ
MAKLIEHPKVKRLAQNIYRWSLPRPLKHMAIAGPSFSLLRHDNGGCDILWKGVSVGQCRPVSELHNTYSGACYVMGTGPSIQSMNLRSLSGQFLIGVNGAIAKFNELGIRPDAYVITDSDFFENRFEMVSDAVASGAKCFFSFAGLSRICKRDPQVLKGDNIYLTEVVNRRYGAPRLSQPDFIQWAYSDQDFAMPDGQRPDDSRVGFSRNLEKGVFCGRTITFRALQIAYYLGFRKLFVLGMDLNYRGDNPRFYETSASMRPTKIDKDYDPYILPAFKVLADLCKQGELSVYNLSSASRLPADIMPRMTLEAALSGESADNHSGSKGAI